MGMLAHLAGEGRLAGLTPPRGVHGGPGAPPRPGVGPGGPEPSPAPGRPYDLMSDSSIAPAEALAALLRAAIKAAGLLPGDERAAALAEVQELERRIGPGGGEDRLSLREILLRVDRLAGTVMNGLRRYPGHPELDGLLAELGECRAALRGFFRPRGGAVSRATGRRGRI